MRLYALSLLSAAVLLAGPKGRPPAPSPLDLYIEEATRHAASAEAQPAAGSLWTSRARLTGLGADLRAVQIDDLVTIVVDERASAVSSGNTQSARTSSAKAGVSALAGIPKATAALPNLLKTEGEQQLAGSGTTSRATTLRTTVAARVTRVLPNGYLVIEGAKAVTINSERQTVTIRGIVRPVDLDTANSVSSDRVAQMEVGVNGKGVVGDAVRRPNVLYRLLLGLLPF